MCVLRQDKQSAGKILDEENARTKDRLSRIVPIVKMRIAKFVHNNGGK